MKAAIIQVICHFLFATFVCIGYIYADIVPYSRVIIFYVLALIVILLSFSLVVLIIDKINRKILCDHKYDSWEFDKIVSEHTREKVVNYQVCSKCNKKKLQTKLTKNEYRTWRNL